MREDDSLDFETLAARAGAHQPVGDGTSTAPSITPSTTYAYDSIAAVHAALGPQPEGYAYSRNANPTVVQFEQVMALLEGAEEVVSFGSGMAAIHAAFLALGLEAGDTVTVASDLYGVTRSLLSVLASFEITAAYVDILDVDSVERTLRETGSRALYFESISNPLLRIPDVPSLVEVAHRCGARVLVDNTFATPFLLRPIELGVDIVIHSATKYIAGHGDVMAGLAAGDRSFASRARGIRTGTGGILSPFEAWLAMRGVKTLPLRLARQSETALSLAAELETRPWVERVYYPGLRSHPQHDLATRLFRGGYSGMIAFDLRADRERTLAFADSLQLIAAATTLGDVVSLLLYPPLSSHRGLNPAELAASGIGESVLRLSVGLESARDLLADLDSAAERSGLAALHLGASASS